MPLDFTAIDFETANSSSASACSVGLVKVQGGRVIDREYWLIKPPIGHIYGYTLEPVDDGTLVTSYYDWSTIDPVWKEADIFPIIPEASLRATLGILARTVTSTNA